MYKISLANKRFESRSTNAEIRSIPTSQQPYPANINSDLPPSYRNYERNDFYKNTDLTSVYEIRQNINNEETNQGYQI